VERGANPGGFVPNSKVAFVSAYETDLSSALLTKQELATLCNVHLRTVDTWIFQRKIPFLKVGRAVRFDRRAVEKALAKYVVREVA
jgi:excisionase family DNA binding protein